MISREERVALVRDAMISTLLLVGKDMTDEQVTQLAEAAIAADERLIEALDDDGLSGMWKARAKRAEAAIEKLESYCFGLETQVRGFRPPVIRELFSTTKADQ